MKLGLEGKVGIVTGASRGIGSAIAAELVCEGCSLALIARSESLVEQAALLSPEGKVLACRADLTNPESVDPLIEMTLATFGRIDFVVCNAGAGRSGSLTDLSDSDWEEGFALKFFGHVRLLRRAWPHLKASRGAVVIIAGAAGRTPSTNGFIAGCVNASLQNLAKALAAMGTADQVNVNVVNPGAIRTGRFRKRLQAQAEKWSLSPELAEKKVVSDGSAMRIGEPEDVASLVAFLLSARSANIHGAMIDIDAGRTKTL